MTWAWGLLQGPNQAGRSPGAPFRGAHKQHLIPHLPHMQTATHSARDGLWGPPAHRAGEFPAGPASTPWCWPFPFLKGLVSEAFPLRKVQESGCPFPQFPSFPHIASLPQGRQGLIPKALRRPSKFSLIRAHEVPGSRTNPFPRIQNPQRRDTEAPHAHKVSQGGPEPRTQAPRHWLAAFKLFDHKS